MKPTFFLFLTAVLTLSFIACNSKKGKIIIENEPVLATVSGDVKPKNDSRPQMEIEARGGMTVIWEVGDGVVGRYDKDKNYWVCSDDEPIFETSPIDGDKKYTLLNIRNQDGRGLIDENGKIVVLPMYFSLQLGFSKGFCKVSNKDYKYGLIAEDGKIVLPTIYDSIWSENISDGLIMASKNGLQGFLNLRGETVIPFEYEALEQAGEGLIWFMQEPQQWGCINYKNETIVQAEFTHTAPFIDGKAKAQKGNGEDYFIYTNGKIEECN